MNLVRGILVYTAIAMFCVIVWAAVITTIMLCGWTGGAVIVVALIAGYEVVFGEWPGRDDFTEPADAVWDDEVAA